MDMGPITAALEYASGKTARVFGKPSELLFSAIAKKFGVNIKDIIMVGDDIEFDVLLPQRLGITGVLVKTGKFLQQSYDKAVKRLNMKPDYIIDGVWELPDLLS